MVTLGGLKWNDPLVLQLGSIALSGFFTYEVCRKLDPTHLRVSARLEIMFRHNLPFVRTRSVCNF